MRISDIVAQYIMDILDESDGLAEIQRNELAGEIGCVPSQINYVITSRFTPEQGYIVESRRGGGGYIRIKRVKTDRSNALMHIINAVGNKLDCNTANVMINNMLNQKIIKEEIASLMEVAVSNKSYACIPIELRDFLRASLFKKMLLSQI